MYRLHLSVPVFLLLYSFATLVEMRPQAEPPSAVPTVSDQKGHTTYDTKFDNIDLDEVLKQERLVTNYVKCLEGIGPCTPDGKMLKETIPDAVATNCSKCSEKQKYGSDKVTQFLIDNRIDDWMRIEKIYDPEGIYRKAYLAEKEKQANHNLDGGAEAVEAAMAGAKAAEAGA